MQSPNNVFEFPIPTSTPISVVSMNVTLETNNDLEEVSIIHREEKETESNKEQQKRLLESALLTNKIFVREKKRKPSPTRAHPDSISHPGLVQNSMENKKETLRKKTTPRAIIVAPKLIQASNSNRNKVSDSKPKTKNISTKKMIINAITDLKGKNGSTPIAIKNYIKKQYEPNRHRLSWITKLLKNANDEGWLVQTSGTGIQSGSYFKLPTENNKDKIIKQTDKKKMVKPENLTKFPQVKLQPNNKNKSSKVINKKIPAPTKKKKIM